jgi:hypothetical protein
VGRYSGPGKVTGAVEFDHESHRSAVKITMTDYLGSQAWRDELIDLLRNNATPPSRAIIIGKDQGLTDEQIAERWRELGGRRVKRCSVVNIWRRWQEIKATLKGSEPTTPRRAHDMAFTLVQALHGDASPEFLQAGVAYYRRMQKMNPTKIRADWRDWDPGARYR